MVQCRAERSRGDRGIKFRWILPHKQGLLASPLQVLTEGKGNDHIVRAKHYVPFVVKPGLSTTVDVLVPFVFNASDSLEP